MLSFIFTNTSNTRPILGDSLKFIRSDVPTIISDEERSRKACPLASEELIIEDYMKSRENLKDMLESFAKQKTSINIDIITPHERYIKEFLNWFKTEGQRAV